METMWERCNKYHEREFDIVTDPPDTPEGREKLNDEIVQERGIEITAIDVCAHPVRALTEHQLSVLSEWAREVFALDLEGHRNTIDELNPIDDWDRLLCPRRMSKADKSVFEKLLLLGRNGKTCATLVANQLAAQ
jgi:hypothetical protein